MDKKKGLALFDFDGTITNKDSFLEFLKYYEGSLKYFFKLLGLLPAIGLFYAKIIDNGELKERFLKRFIKGVTPDEFIVTVEKFYSDVVPGFLRRYAVDKIKWHKSMGHDVALVSASAELWLKPFADKHEMTLICTELETLNGAYTGLLQGANCNGAEKVLRIKDHFNVSEYDRIYAYGDSSGDREMLDFADEAFYKPFRS